MMSGKTHGYLLTNGTITPFDVPGSLSTQAWDLSPSGEIAGIYVDTTTRVRGTARCSFGGEFPVVG
jgi:uncharacterized membrane protein